MHDDKEAVELLRDAPLITDTTEFISPEIAQEMLTRNRRNRPVNWQKVEEYSQVMRGGGWKLHPQGIILDGGGNILTGQTRLWAVIYSGTSQYFRVSRGTPAETAAVIDRGRPQSARDLASRQTEKKHSPSEASLSRAICILRGNTRPSIDAISAVIVEKQESLRAALEETHGTKKTKAVLMIIAAICECSANALEVRRISKATSRLAEQLDRALAPHSAASCWGKGTAFGMALEQARKIALTAKESRASVA